MLIDVKIKVARRVQIWIINMAELFTKYFIVDPKFPPREYELT